jgi:hypothetical protein
MNDTAQAPVTLTREELYALVWELPMIRLGERFGISGTGLAKICKRLGIPYPPGGHWMKVAAGKSSPIIVLPPAAGGVEDRVTIAPWSAKQDARKPEVVAALAAASAAKPPIAVKERLAQPHAIIAKWLADHERRAKEARAERDSWRRGLMMPTPFTDVDRRRHRVLDALLKSLEREGISLSDEGRWQLSATRGGDAIEFQLRERFKQVRRVPTADEKRWHSSREFVQELQPTGALMFEIKTYLPSGLTRTWREAEEKPLEGSLPSILQTVLAAFRFSKNDDWNARKNRAGISLLSSVDARPNRSVVARTAAGAAFSNLPATGATPSWPAPSLPRSRCSHSKAASSLPDAL